MRLTIGMKLGFGIGIILAIFVIAGFVSYLQTRTVNRKFQEILEVDEPTSAATYEMEINLIGTGFGLLGYLHNRDPQHLERIEKDRGDFEHFYKKYNEYLESDARDFQDAYDEGRTELGVKAHKGFKQFRAIADGLVKIEDEQTQKMEALAKNFVAMDTILDDKIQQAIKPDDPQAYRKLHAALEMEINTNGIGKGLAKFLMTHNTQYVKRVHDDEGDFKRFFDEYVSLPLSAREKRWAEQINHLFDENVGLALEIIEMDEAKEKSLARFVEIRRELDTVLDDEIQALIHEDLAKAKEEALQASDRSNITIIIGLFLALGFGSLAGVAIFRSIADPVKQLVSSTEVIAKGDLSERVAIRSEDEIGLLARAFNRMTEDLQRTTVSRAYVENIIDSMTESLIVVLPEGSIQTVNIATCNLLGYEEKELIGKPFDKILSKRSKHLNVNHLMQKQIVSNAEEKYLSKDGREIPVLFSSMFMPHIDGHVQGIVCVANDITEIKKAEEALRESEEKLTGIINSVTDQMIMLDDQRNIVWANAVAERLFGPGLIGKKCTNTRSLIDQYCEPCLLKKCFEDGESHEQEMQFKGIDGNRMDFWVTTSVAARHEGGRPKMVVEVFHNITERKALQAEAMRTSHLASIGELAAGVAHEIINPTNSIINLSQILADESDQEGLVYDIAGRIIKEGDRIASIVSSLLSFGRDRKEEKSPVNLQQIVSETLALSRAQLRKDGINPKVDIPQNLPDIIAQPQQIQQVFMNILNNARYALNQKYPRDQSGKVLEILAEELTVDNSSYVRITFFDRGTGIATDILEQVMEPFFSTKPNGMGSGLGLSICHGIISDHGGKLRIESNEGEHTKMIVDFPAGGKNGRNDSDRR